MAATLAEAAEIQSLPLLLAQPAPPIAIVPIPENENDTEDDDGGGSNTTVSSNNN